MKIALASPNLRWENKAENKKVCEALVLRASRLGAGLVIFPEMTLTGFSMNTALIAEEKENSETLDFFSARSRIHKIAVIFGVVWKRGTKATNNLVCLDAKGRVKADYAKMHPFSLAGETRFYKKGTLPVLCKLGGISFGFSICYDLRFPEIFSALVPHVQAFVNIASWPHKRIEHWYALLKARAIENQCYMIGVNRTGTDALGVVYKKSSVVFDPNGGVLPPISCKKELDFYQLDMKDQRKFRREYPFLNDRRDPLYRSLYR